MVSSTAVSATVADENDVWHKPFNIHPFTVSEKETPAQIRERSLKAREIGRQLTKGHEKRVRDMVGTQISASDYHLWGGRDNIIGCYQDFYFLFMTDPFMNTLFDFSRQPVDHMTHGKRLGSFFLQFFGGDDGYSEIRSGHPLSNLTTSHNRAKSCPLRGKYQGRQFTLNQMHTWVGYQHMAAEGRGFKGAEYKKMMDWILNGLRIYAPFE